MLRRCLFYFLMGFSLFACVESKEISFKTVSNSVLSIPAEIKKIGVLDRCRYGKAPKLMALQENKNDKDSTFQDKFSVDDVLRGLVTELSKTDRFLATQLQGIGTENVGINNFSEPLNWPIIEQLCIENSVDALVVLEFFDTNKHLNFYTENQTIVRNGISQNQIIHLAKLTADVVIGWRMYYPVSKNIIDEWRTIDYTFAEAKGATVEDAEKNLPLYSTLVAKLAKKTGQHYAARVAPITHTTKRNIFVLKNDNIKNIDNTPNNEIINNYETLYKTEKREKEKGLIAHNIAVLHEKNGDLEMAINWAKTAVSHGISSSKNYLNALENRKQEELLLKVTDSE